MKFLEKIISELLAENQDLSHVNMVLPGKRPIIFIKKILAEKGYSGFLPHFFTIEDLIKSIANQQHIQGVSMWLFAFEIYKKAHPSEEFSNFLKWFPTLLKDWDDILKFSESEEKLLEYMFEEESLKIWAENLGDSEDIPRRKFLNFWKKNQIFLPELKKNLKQKNWATSGMIHEIAKEKIENFVKDTRQKFVFCGFNAFTPVEEKLVKSLLQWDKAKVFFQADRYYMEDERQEAGVFLRKHLKWKEFNNNRDFHWIEDDFNKEKEITVFEVSGNVSQTKILPRIFKDLDDDNLSKTAIVLLDENLLPACLEAISNVEYLNITMGFPLKNLGFSNAIKHLFYLQKKIAKKTSYYYKDVMTILEEMPFLEEDNVLIKHFKAEVEQKNRVYLSEKQLKTLLGSLSYFPLLTKLNSVKIFLEELINYCFQVKFREVDDILYENITHFESSFKIIKNQLEPYSFALTIEDLEVLINQIVGTESIDFQGEPLQGLQVMGLLETRLLNFENIILLSVNEGKLPLGNSQNTYLPFDVRKQFDLHTFLENDSIYAYHFYRLLQDSKKVFLLYNALSSGANSGEKSRFITQLEVESKAHQIKHVIIENPSEPIEKQLITIKKTKAVLEKLALWKNRVSASHLTSYLYNPISFYLNKILGTKELDGVEEELSQRNYGNLVHYALQIIYDPFKGKLLQTKDLSFSDEAIDLVVNKAIAQLNHLPEYYENGMNYIHKSIATRIIKSILEVDKNLVESGHELEILSIEENFQEISFFLDENNQNKVDFYGYIDRIDRLDGILRIIDYKTAKTKNLSIPKPKKPEDEGNILNLFFREDYKQAMQLCIYAFAILEGKKHPDLQMQCGIWSFAEVNKGVQNLQIFGDEEINKNVLFQPMESVKNLILEILDPDIDFVEKEMIFFEK